MLVVYFGGEEGQKAFTAICLLCYALVAVVVMEQGSEF